MIEINNGGLNVNFNVNELLDKHPLLYDMQNYKEVSWFNPNYKVYEIAEKKLSLSLEDISDAEERLKRFAPYLEKVFPELESSNGIIESELKEIQQFKSNVVQDISGNVFIKCDSHLPISGSVKSRGGIYEVLKLAEEIAIGNNLLDLNDNYSILTREKFKHLFSKYTIVVGSTGNLGLSIGIISAVLGFKVKVHMSLEAKLWKKELLKSKGVQVIEHVSDYSNAVKKGRLEANSMDNHIFIDDENSKDLFMGYAVAALRLKKQLEEKNINISKENPLIVYLPCGVGGGPGGITFGLKTVFQDSVHCFFAEPTHSPSMLLGLETQLHDQISVNDLGIDNITIADGLAVARASGFVGQLLNELINGVYTVSDEKLSKLLWLLNKYEHIELEPSALAALAGLLQRQIQDKYDSKNTTHIIWATGGGMVPRSEMNKYLIKGKFLIEDESNILF